MATSKPSSTEDEGGKGSTKPGASGSKSEHLSSGQKLVLAAVILLIAAAIILVAGNEVEANRTAVLSYYFLVLGVTNLLVEYSKEGWRPTARLITSLLLIAILACVTKDLACDPTSWALLLILSSFLVITTFRIRVSIRIRWRSVEPERIDFHRKRQRN